MRQTIVLALAAFVFVAASTATPAWLSAKPGAVEFLGAGDEDSPTAPVCSTIAAYKQYVKENGALGCIEKPQGVRITIEAITHTAGVEVPIVKVRANDRSFRGYTALGVLVPQIPAGVAVTLKPGESEKITIAQSQHAELDNGTDLGPHATAVTLRFDPAIADGRDLLVRVTSGKMAGKTGWLYARQAYVNGTQAINVLTLQ